MLCALLAQVAPGPVGQAAASFLGSGLLGATCVVLAAVIASLWIDARRERKEANARDTAAAARAVAREGEWQAAWQNREREYQSALSSLQAQRVADAQAVAASNLRVNEQNVQVLTRVLDSLETIDTALSSSRAANERLADEVRRSYGKHP